MSQDSTDRIVAGMRAWISAAAPGAQVPSNRALTAQYSASPVTVQKAMRQLISLGLVESRPGVGTFVRSIRSPRPADYGWQTGALGAAPPTRTSVLSSTQRPIAADAIGLHSGYPTPALLPERLVRQAITRAARSAAAIVSSPAAGNLDLQTWFANEVASASPAGITGPSAP